MSTSVRSTIGTERYFEIIDGMDIGILITDAVREELIGEHGDYPTC